MINKKNKKYNLLIIGSLPVYLGAKQHSGLGNVVWGLAKSLKEKGESFAIAARGKYFIKFKEVEGVPIYGLSFSFSVFINCIWVIVNNREMVLKISGLYYRLRLFYALYFLIFFTRKIDFKIIHMHHVTNQMPLAARLLGLEQPIVGHIHSYSNIINEKSTKKRNQIIQNINLQLQCVNYIIHVSRTVRKQGLEFGIQWNVPEKVIYNGIKYSLDEINKLMEPKENKMICFAGAFLNIKGIDIFIDTLQLIRDSVEKVIFIGDGPLRKEIENKCNDLNIRYEITGFVSNEKVLEIISRCELLVLPSRSESFGQVYVEALLVGTPAIGYYRIVNEFNETFHIKETEQQLLIPFNNSHETFFNLAEKIKNNITITMNMPDQLRTRIFNNVYWPYLIDTYINIYTDLLHK